MRPFSVKDRRDIQHLDKGNPYYEYRKYPEPTECPGCGLVFIHGRWAVSTVSKAFKKSELCPACRLTRDAFPLGIALFEGATLDGPARTEIRRIVDNVARKVAEKRPLQRIMKVEESDRGLTVYTTYDHLARRIGDSVYRALKGELTIRYTEGERFARVHWHRD